MLAPRRTLRPVVVALLLGLTAPAAAVADGSGTPSPGAAGIGDRLFPTLGNGGYDALHYTLDLRYATSSPTQGLEGTATIVARATQALSRFNLDFAGGGVAAVSVNGRAATWAREGEELVITPRRPLSKGRAFRVRVEAFTATPTKPDPAVASSAAFFTTPDGTATAPQPNFAHLIYPSNDHPRDKASFTFRLDVPAGVTAVANGVLSDRRERGERTTWTYHQRQPMAAELTQIAVGDFAVSSPGEHPGVLVRDVTPRRLQAELTPKLAVELQHLDWIEERVGGYPFDVYGSLVVDEDLGFALETQTLSIFDLPWFTDYPEGLWNPVMMHELAHQWFGNSVAPWEWSDLWLNEGHASWYEFVWAQERGFLPEDTAGPDGPGPETLEELMRQVYALGDQWRSEFGPVAQPLSGDPFQLFSPNVYSGGALVLYALRQEIGEQAFDRLQRAWVSRYEGESASTGDFIALASHVAGRDLETFLRSWLYGTTTPPMPGHTDWTVDPVGQPAPA
jgi:aminopeptidase N